MPYRNAREALEYRCESIAATLASMRARCAEIDALRTEMSQLEASLSHARSQLASLDTRADSPLDHIEVATPCTADWNAMAGTDRVRFCGSCQKNVYNLSAMTRDEAEAVLAEHTDRLCARLYRRADGTVLTADCPEGVAQKRKRRVRLSVLGSGVLAAAAAAGFATTRSTAHAAVSRELKAEPPIQVSHGMVALPELGDAPVPRPTDHTQGGIRLRAPGTTRPAGTRH